MADGSGTGSFINLFYISIAVSFIYAIISFRAIEHAKKDSLGVDKDGNKAAFPHP